MLASRAVSRGFEPLSGQTRDLIFGICCVSAKHTSLRNRRKDCLARNQDNVSNRSDIYTLGHLFQSDSAIPGLLLQSDSSISGLFEVYEYFTIFSKKNMSMFQEYLMQQSLKLGSINYNFKWIKVSGIAPYWKVCIFSFA